MSVLNIFEIERFAINDGPGIRTTIFFQGCPLRCQWCANPESQAVGKHILCFRNKCAGCSRCVKLCDRKAIRIVDGKAVIERKDCIACGKCAETCPNAAIKVSGKQITDEELFEIILRDKEYYDTSGGGVTLSGGEAIVQMDGLIPFLKKCKMCDIPVAVETCGHVSISKIQEAEKYIDIFLFDLKSLDENKFREYTGGNLKMVFSSFAYLSKAARDKIIVRVPVIPGFNDNEIIEIMKYTAKNRVKEIHLLPYHTLGISKYKQMGIEYPYAVTEGLSRESLHHYIDAGEKMGLIVRIGG